MNVIFISPGFPAEMPHFTRGLAQVGARVLGIGDGPVAGVTEDARRYLSDYLQVRQLWQEDQTIEEVKRWVKGRQIDRVECLWEPGVVLAARLREALGIPGMGVEQATWFRDKERMKEVLDEAGVRTPRHARARTTQEVRDAAERIDFPLIIKPIDGAGSADTYPVHDEKDLEESLALTKHVPEVSVEEYVEGEEFTFDTVCAGGDILFHNVAWYRPKPLIARLNAWVSSQAIALRDTTQPEIAVGVELGRKVLQALGFQTGFTHMEWFRKADGEAVFGEIGARAPGARLVHAMNYAAETDLFAGWAEAVCYGRLSQNTEKRFNASLVFKRAEGNGTVRRYEGLDAILAKYGEHITSIELTPIGQPRRDWKKSTVGDGWIVARHPNLEIALEIANRLTTDLRIIAG